MHLADLTVNFTLNDLTLWVIAGAVGGLGTGRLIKTRGMAILADLFFGIVGGLIGISVIGTIIRAGQYGLPGQLLLVLSSGVLGEVVARSVIVLRRRARAAS